MQEIMRFENNDVEIIQDENGEPLFEIYSTGMALGYVTVAKGKVYPQKIRIDKIVKNAEIKPVVHGVQLFINESQLYDFMLEARTDKCRIFRKWVTNEVLPSIRKTGNYSIPKAPSLPYTYINKVIHLCRCDF
nr:MAG TPA: antirepressor [Caudoviricetes sp.]